MIANNVPDISVCLVNLNTADLLRECLQSIYCQEWQVTLEAIVVDNASTDHSVSMLREEFPQVKLIANSTYQGFSRGNNQAFESASGRYLLMLNTDTLVKPGAFDAMVEFMDAHPEAGALGCKLLNPDGSLQRSCWRGFPSLKSAVIDAFYLWKLAPGSAWVRLSEIPEEEMGHTIEVDHVIGASMLIRREVMDQVGMLNESYKIFLEETDLCFRMKQAGWKVYFDPGAEVIHFGQQSVLKVPDWTQVQKYRNFYKFCRENRLCSNLKLPLLKVTFILACVVRIGLWGYRRLKSDDNKDLSVAMMKGYWNVLVKVPAF